VLRHLKYLIAFGLSPDTIERCLYKRPVIHAEAFVILRIRERDVLCREYLLIRTHLDRLIVNDDAVEI
jgi:hypothetical protein